MSIFKKLKEFFRRSSSSEIDKWVDKQYAEIFCADCDNPKLECSCRAEWNVVLVSPGWCIYDIIKAVQQVTGWSLEEARATVGMSECCPFFVSVGLHLQDALEVHDRLVSSGAKVVITNEDFDTFMRGHNKENL